MHAPPLSVLKKALTQLQIETQPQHDALLARIQRGEKLTKNEETWLDREGNLVDEVGVMNALENAEDYGEAYVGLSSAQREAVTRLFLVLATKNGEAGKKRKRSSKVPPTDGEPASSASASKKKENATLAQRIEILDWFHSSTHKNQSKTATHFNKIYPALNIRQPVISQWLKDEKKWRTQWSEAQSRGQGSSKRTGQGNFPEINDMVEVWVAKALVQEGRVGGERMREMWGRFADLEGVPIGERLSLSTGWLDAMKKRCALRDYRLRGEGKAGGAVDVDAERARIRGVVARFNYPLKNIFNMDETILCYAMPPDRSYHSHPPSTSQLTLILTTNADGSEKLPPFIIGTSSRPPSFGTSTPSDLGIYYRSHVMGWLSVPLYQEWLVSWDARLRKQARYILLLVDDLGVHRPPDGLTNIRVEKFSPGTGEHVQPMEAGIMRAFKSVYREKFVHRAIDRFEVGAAGVYDIDLLEAMRLVEVAWNGVDEETIRVCWRRCGILPGMVDVPPLPSAVAATHATHDPRPEVHRNGTVNWYDDVNQLEAIRIAAAAWEESNTTRLALPTPSHTLYPPTQSLPSFHHLPSPTSHLRTQPLFSPSPPTPTPTHIYTSQHTQTQLTNALYELESRGLLYPQNRLSLEEIVSPMLEQGFMMRDVGDEEIWRAVRGAALVSHREEGGEGGELFGGGGEMAGGAVRSVGGGAAALGGSVHEGVGEIETKPTRKEVLQAAFIVQCYLADLNSPFARSMERKLIKFGKDSMDDVEGR